jgi:hypothetical protein
MRTASEPASRRTKLLRAAVVLAALLIGWAVGHTTSTSPSPRPPAPTTAETGAGSPAGVPTSFPDTEVGAADAVAAYQRSFASPQILRPGVLRERIEAVASPDYVETMLAANAPGEERLAAGALGAGLASGVKTIYSAIPIGWKVESFTSSRARILTWGFTLLGNASSVEPAAFFGLTHTELVREAGTWKIAGTRAGFGPTPKLATEPGPLGGYDVIDLAQELRSYALAP